MKDIEGVMVANRAHLARVRELNTRAGRNIFPVPNREELAKFFATALSGARRVAEIRNLPALLLPPLDQKVVDKVLAESPDSITVLGRDVSVEYRSGYNPRVRLDFRGDERRNWLKLPDEGIHLPGGREVSMYSLVEGYGYYIESISSQFKAKARECLNQELWDNWQKLELPTPAESIAPVLEMEYGRCVATDASLIAYGAVNYDSWYGSWKSYWTRDRAEAERVHAQAFVKFVEVKERAVRDVLLKRVSELYRTHGENNELDDELRARMYNTYYGYSGGATTVAELEALIAEAEAAVATLKKRKEEAERRQCEAEAAPVDFSKLFGGAARVTR